MKKPADHPASNAAATPAPKSYKGAEIMVEYLIKEKVPYLFGVCGHGNIGFLDAAAKAADRITTISVHHEQAAGYMADAYYKVKHFHQEQQDQLRRSEMNLRRR